MWAFAQNWNERFTDGKAVGVSVDLLGPSLIRVLGVGPDDLVAVDAVEVHVRREPADHDPALADALHVHVVGRKDFWNNHQELIL